MTRREPTIGILGGMGARATAPFVDLVVDQCQRQYGASYDDEFPHMLVYALPARLRLDEPLDHPRLSGEIVAGLQRLERGGVDFIALPCNTAHRYYDQLQAAIGVPLLHIVDETLARLPAGLTRVGLLATEFTVESGLYQRGFEAAGLEFVHRDAWQRRVNALLEAIKDAPDAARLAGDWRALLEDVQGAGVDLAVLGCTDLNAVSRHVTAPPLPIADATEKLAAATVEAYRQRVGVAA